MSIKINQNYFSRPYEYYLSLLQYIIIMVYASPQSDIIIYITLIILNVTKLIRKSIGLNFKHT